jgi:hypothetical protein
MHYHREPRLRCRPPSVPGGLPVLWHQRADIILVAHGRQAAEHVAQIRVGIDPVPLASHHNRVDDRAASSSARRTDKKPVLFTDRTGAYRIASRPAGLSCRFARNNQVIIQFGASRW